MQLIPKFLDFLLLGTGLRDQIMMSRSTMPPSTFQSILPERLQRAHGYFCKLREPEIILAKLKEFRQHAVLRPQEIMAVLGAPCHPNDRPFQLDARSNLLRNQIEDILIKSDDALHFKEFIDGYYDSVFNFRGIERRFGTAFGLRFSRSFRAAHPKVGAFLYHSYDLAQIDTSSQVYELLNQLDHQEIVYSVNFYHDWDEVGPLVRAAETGDSELVKLLIQKGANVNFRNSLGENVALQASVFNQIFDSEQLLLDAGARF